MTVLYVLLAVLMLGIMVMVHEAGHFFAARMTGIPVKGFGIGFGPKIHGRKSKKTDTQFVLRWIPAGGYCSFYGEDDPKADGKDPRFFRNQKAWKRLIVILAGPVMNFILAYIVCLVYMLCLGSIAEVDYNLPCQIKSVSVASAAQEAGLLPGDQLLEVNGKNIVGLNEAGGYKFSDAVSSYNEESQPLVITVLRGEEKVSLSVTPRWTIDQSGSARYMIGIEYAPQYQIKVLSDPLVLLRESWGYMIEVGGSILAGFGTLFSSWKNLTTMGSGPVGVVSTIAQQTQAYGADAYIQLLIIISVNLGLVNLIPFPGLDGSRALFILFQIIFRRPVNEKIEAWIHLIGFVFLFALILLFTWNDILRIFGA